jgi:hypothetical protein
MATPSLPKHYSHSFLDLFFACPAAAALKLNGEPQIAPDYMQRGSDLHQGIQRYAVGCWEKRVMKDLPLMEAIAAGYAGAVHSSLLNFAKEAWWPWRKLVSTDVGECPVEQMWECTLPNGEKFVGRIDLALVGKGAAKDNPFAESDDTVKIIDWKQGRPATFNAPDPPRQLLRYAVLYRRNVPSQHDFVLMYGAPGWKGKWAFKAWGVSRVEVDRAERELCGQIDRVRMEERWQANPGDACSQCLYTAACPLRGTETFTELTGVSADNLAQAAVWHAAMSADAKKRLKALAEANGGEAAGWGWNTSTSLRPVMDAESFAETLRKAGHDVMDLRGGFDKNKIKRAIKDEWLDEGAFEEVPTGRTFGPLKQTGEGDDQDG